MRRKGGPQNLRVDFELDTNYQLRTVWVFKLEVEKMSCKDHE